MNGLRSVSGKLRAEARNSDYGTTDPLPGVVRWGQVSSDRDTVRRGRDRPLAHPLLA